MPFSTPLLTVVFLWVLAHYTQHHLTGPATPLEWAGPQRLAVLHRGSPRRLASRRSTRGPSRAAGVPFPSTRYAASPSKVLQCTSSNPSTNNRAGTVSGVLRTVFRQVTMPVNARAGLQVCVLPNATPFSPLHSCVTVKRKKFRIRNVSALARSCTAGMTLLFLASYRRNLIRAKAVLIPAWECQEHSWDLNRLSDTQG